MGGKSGRKSIAGIALAVAVALSGCGPGSSTPTATPFGPFTQQQANACSAADLGMLAWNDDAGETARSVVYALLGDAKVARVQTLAATKKLITELEPLDGATVGAADKLAAVKTAAQSAVQSLAKPMTVPVFTVAHKSVSDAITTFSDACDSINSWVRDHVAQ